MSNFEVDKTSEYYKYEAKVIADSIADIPLWPQLKYYTETTMINPLKTVRLITVEVVLPRIVLAELNTHRVFSRNSASSRAIPVEKQLKKIKEMPFVPLYWGKNQKGMQAYAELSPEKQEQAKEVWLSARDAAVAHAEKLLAIGVHKQISNRLLEPYMWHTVIITATNWANFIALRNNPEAQPEIRYAAEEILKAISESWKTGNTKHLSFGEYHLPYIQEEERDGRWERTEEARWVSAARCARVSYLTQDGIRDIGKDLELAERLRTSGHMSPFEHVATPMKAIEDAAHPYSGNFYGWEQFRKTLPHEDNFANTIQLSLDSHGIWL